MTDRVPRHDEQLAPEVMLRQYEILVTEGLDDDDLYETEAILALIERDGLEDVFQRLDERQRARLEELDEILISKRERLLDWLPSAVEQDRRRWWWFLHEGPPPTH